ncbi:molecular chaperone [Massilia sp. TS11]|uniref:molecular chaperone n=1 Tax=Massilia sp. TS11 TaxID=2908003 RepID=UPI001EDA3CEF|nr:molecular chaperone [Massilia sp. TS11]MCG2586474.1 molecular chaperone [Massilia sp. TS11]
MLRLLLLCLLLAARPALADLMINPTRIVLDKNQRSAQIDLINNGNETATYRVSVVNRRMSETGDFSVAEQAQPGELFADQMISYSPRQIVLAPGASQLVRVLVRKPENLAAGEYRSHLVFERIADPAAPAPAEGATVTSNEVGIKLTALVGVSIPVIVRQGETSASVSLGQLALAARSEGQPQLVTFDISRSGNRSVYGDIVLSFTPEGGSEMVLAKAAGVAVYVPNALRRAKLALAPGTSLSKGRLTVRFHARPEEGGKALAETSVTLP